MRYNISLHSLKKNVVRLKKQSFVLSGNNLTLLGLWHINDSGLFPSEICLKHLLLQKQGRIILDFLNYQIYHEMKKKFLFYHSIKFIISDDVYD